MADDLLDSLLSVAIEQISETTEPGSSPKASFTDTLGALDKPHAATKIKKPSTSSQSTLRLTTVHRGDTDSSDDEDNRDFENRKYNESGRDIKHLLEAPIPAGNAYSKPNTWKAKPAARAPESSNPIFGIRIVNPLVSSKMLEDRLSGREVIPMARMKMFIRNVSSDKDWVVAGAIVHKSATKTSQKGKNYCILTLSDLKSDLKTVVVFLFSSAYTEFWKTVTGTVIGILNPSVMELREGYNDEACLSISNHQQVMIIGQSKDLGTCKSTRKNGERCTAFVNTNMCEFCIYHVKQEYQKASRRSDIQSGFAGRGLTALRNKVLGKNQVFYAGKLYSAIPATKNRKQVAKDNGRLRSLAGLTAANPRKAPVKTKKQKQAAQLEIAADQRRKDIERLKQLGINTELKLNNRVETFNGAPSRDVTVEDSKSLALDVISKLKKSHCDAENLKTKKVVVMGESTFSGALSRDVTVEGSKNLALGVISKLRKSRGNGEKNQGNVRVPGDSHEEEKITAKPLEENTQKKTNGKLKEPAKQNNFKLVDKSDDDIDLNVDFKNFQKNFLKPQTAKQDREVFKPLPQANKVDQSRELNLNETKVATSINSNLQNPPLSNCGRVKSDLERPLKNKRTVETNKTENQLELEPKLLTNLTKASSSDLHFNLQNPSLHQDLNLTKAVNSNPHLDSLSLQNCVPTLSSKGKSRIDLTMPIRRKQEVRARQNAVSWIHSYGPIEKLDPNNTRGSEKGKKRALENLSENAKPKKTKVEENGFFSERFKKMMAATSRHVDLLQARDDEEQEKYFHKQEMKERMEEKMLTTYKVACKAVRCLRCKYTSFSASDLCKTEKHPLRVFDAMKRFFKCGNCGNRTVCLDMIPTTSCNNCGSSKWEKTSMMKERKVEIAAPKLSIRGGEQKFTNSVVGDSNLNLMVPDE